VTPIGTVRASASTSVGTVERTDGGWVASFTIDPDDPVFRGHYPGYPVMPGVYLIELADCTVRALLESGPAVRLAAVERCRFLAPVYQGDTVTLEILSDEGDDPRFVIRAITGRGAAADLTLGYRTKATR